MKKSVYIWFKFDPAVRVGNDPLSISDVSPSLIKSEINEPEKLDMIQYNGEGSTIDLCYSDGRGVLVDETEYENYVKPYVDLWQAEKDRLEKEEQEAQAEYNKFENRQARALTTLNTEFEQAKTDAHLTSSLGFEIDANQTANENITGLLVTIGNATTQFCDYNNVFHEVNKADLETMQTEIIQNAQYLYQQKWSYRTQIEECTDGDALDEILAQIEFRYKDFTQ